MPRRISVSIAVIAASTFAASQQVNAQESGLPSATVEIKGSADAIRRDDTASRVVVGHDELVKYGDGSVLDAMKRLPGLTVSNGSVKMHGLGNGYTQILVNGDRPPAGFTLETLAPESIQKIEIIRAATAEYSTQSIAGTINVILRKTAAKKSGEVKVSQDGGPGVRSPGVNLELSDKNDGFNYTLGTSVRHNDKSFASSAADSARTVDGALTELRLTESQYHYLSTVINANARLGWTLDNGDSVTWQTFLSGGPSHGTEDNHTVTVAGPEYPYPSLPVRFDGTEASLRSDLTLTKKFASGSKLDTKFGLYHSKTERGLLRQGVRSGILVLDRDFVSNILDNGFNTTGKYQVPLFDGHAFTLGWDGGRGLYRHHDNQVDQPSASTVPFDFDTRFNATLSRLAAYAQDEWEIRSGWSVYLGVRWEGLHTGTTASNMTPVSMRSSIVSPLMQTLWKIPGTKEDQLRLALTRTYRAPTLFNLVPSRFYNTFNTEVSPDFVGNPALRPELATGINAAYEHYLSGGGLVSLSASSRAIRDFIRNTVAFDGTRWVSSPTNLGGAHVYGLEFESKLPLKSLGSKLPLELRANVSRNWSSVDAVPGPGNRLDQQPRWSATVGADYTGSVVSAGTSFSYVSGDWTRTSVFESAYGGPTRDLEAYLLYKLDARRQWRFTARNLLATDRLNASRYADAGGQFDRSSVFPTYRTWRLQYEHKFQ